MFRKSLSAITLGCVLIIPSAAAAQDSKPKAVGIIISVVERSDSSPTERPFASVGLFKLLLGDGVFDKGQCPSRSNSKGSAACRVLCDPNDTTELTLVLRPPGSDAVPGYEVPVSKELTLTGCDLSDARVTFTYTPLELALRETLTADPELRQAVAIGAPSVNFASLKPFEESQPQLAALIERKPDDPNVARFARILHDASVSGAATPTINPSTVLKVQKLSVGTQSIYMNTAVKRTLGPAKASQIAPITTDAARLRTTTKEFATALDKKPEKTPSEVVLHKELSRVQPASGKSAMAQPPKIEWAKVNHAGVSKSVK